MAHIPKGAPLSNGFVLIKRTRQTNTLGVTTMVEIIDVNFADRDSFIPLFNTPHATFTNLFYQDCSEEDDEGLGLTTITRNYAGLSAAASAISPDSIPPVYEWIPESEAVPIERHPWFKFAVAKAQELGREPLDSMGRFVAFPSETLIDGRDIGGISTFPQFAGRWRKSWVTTTRPPGFEGVGKIGTPSGPAPSFPESEKRTYLVTAPVYRQMGGVFEVTQEWILSGIGGHSPFLDTENPFTP